jgi:hypothetical protein
MLRMSWAFFRGRTDENYQGQGPGFDASRVEPTDHRPTGRLYSNLNPRRGGGG